MYNNTIMATKITHIMQYDAPVKELIISKLALFHSKVILNQFTRLIVLMPMESQIHRTDKHKSMFDEIITVRFNSADSHFWNNRCLYRFYYYMNSLTDIDNDCIYVDYGIILPNVPEISSSSQIVAANKADDSSIMEYINEQMHSKCGFEKLKSESLQYYDFSIFHISDETRNEFSRNVKKIIKAYDNYIDQKCAYAILSWLCCYLSISVRGLDMLPVNITHSDAVDDFYTII